MAKKFNLNAFLKLSPEEQAKSIEKETKELIKRLPNLKKQLKMYGDTSDELYNLNTDELDLIGSTYARAVRSGEITTPTAKASYNKFIQNLRKYARVDIGTLARQTADARMDSWIEHIDGASFDADKEYAHTLFDSMTEEEKLGFTRSKYFMDSQYMYEVVDVSGNKYSIQTLKLELYLKERRGKEFDNIYDTFVRKKK